MATVAPNPHSPYATADPSTRHLLPGFPAKPQPGQLTPTGCDRLAVAPDEPLRSVTSGGNTFPPGICAICIQAWYASLRGQALPDARPLTLCGECGSETRHDGLCALCRQEKHAAWWPTRGKQPAAEPERALPHDPYIHAVVEALTAAGLGPDDSWTSDAEVNRYDTGPDAGCAMQLDAHLVWTMPTGGHPHGVHLVWEHPAEQWQWAPRRADGVLAHDPEFLPMLPRWAHPAGVVEVVRELLAGRPLPKGERIRWQRHAEMQDAVDAWAAADASA